MQISQDRQMQKKQRIKVGGDWYIAIDIGVDDLERAEQNRQMVTEGRYIQGYLEVENWLEHHKATEQLPAQYVGHLPGKATEEGGLNVPSKG